MSSEPVPLTPVLKPHEPSTMNFFDAMKRVMEGKKVARLTWTLKEYILLREGWVQIFTEKDKDWGFHEWIIKEEELKAEDWVIVTNLN